MFNPKKIEDIIGNYNIRKILLDYLDNGNLPNFIFIGPNGCGKSLTAQILIKTYLGEYYKYYNLEINGSVDRGKNVISENTKINQYNIINFIKKRYIIPENILKFVTIYDFDCMRDEAQMALRRIIELYSNKIRFIFICKNLNNIVEAIQSRALILKFCPINSQDIKTELIELTNNKLDNEIYDTIILLSNGDIRQAYNYIKLFMHSNNRNLINFYELFGIPEIKFIKQILMDSINKKSSIVFRNLQILLNKGYNNYDIINIILNLLIYTTEINKKHKVLFFKHITKCLNSLNHSDSKIHLYNLFVQIIIFF